jgi:two-component system response regulator YesN
VHILIVDDETLIRESIQRILQKLNITQVNEAKDGIEALELLQVLKPDLIIADIRMPGMDGLMLMEHVNKLGMDILFIFVSGYDSFEYAKHAIQLGALDYMLKPIKEVDLQQILKRAKERIQLKETQVQLLSQMSVTLNHGLHFMRRHFLQDLVRQNSFSETYVLQKFNELQIYFHHPKFVVFSISVNQYHELSSSLSLKERELITFSLDNIVQELIQKHGLMGYTFEMEEGIGVLINLIDDQHLGGESWLKEVGEIFRSSIRDYTKYSVTIGIGSIVERLLQVRTSYETACKAISQRLLKGNNKVYIYQESSEHEKIMLYSINLRMEQMLVTGLEKRDLQMVEYSIRQLLEPYEHASIHDANGLMKLNFQLIMMIFKIMKQLGADPEVHFSDEFKLYHQVNSCDSVDQVIEWFLHKVGVVIAVLDAMPVSQDTALTDKVRSYILQNYSKEISLETAASYVNLSPSYLSKLFKDEVGENFSNYLLNYRMHIARSLLKEGVFKANVVAHKVGFHDEKYFYKVFKKITGYTPSEYKNL